MRILLQNDPVFEQAHKTYNKFTTDDELLQVYEAREKDCTMKLQGFLMQEKKACRKGLRNTLYLVKIRQ